MIKRNFRKWETLHFHKHESICTEKVIWVGDKFFIENTFEYEWQTRRNCRRSENIITKFFLFNQCNSLVNDVNFSFLSRTSDNPKMQNSFWSFFSFVIFRNWHFLFELLPAKEIRRSKKNVVCQFRLFFPLSFVVKKQKTCNSIKSTSNHNNSNSYWCGGLLR